MKRQQQHNTSLKNKLARVNPAARALVVGRAHGSCHAQRALNLPAIQHRRVAYTPSNASISQCNVDLQAEDNW